MMCGNTVILWIVVKSYLSTVDVVEDEVEFLLRLKRWVKRHEKRMVLIVAQHVAFGHDVMRLVAPNYRALL